MRAILLSVIILNSAVGLASPKIEKKLPPENRHEKLFNSKTWSYAINSIGRCVETKETEYSPHQLLKDHPKACTLALVDENITMIGCDKSSNLDRVVFHFTPTKNDCDEYVTKVRNSIDSFSREELGYVLMAEGGCMPAEDFLLSLSHVSRRHPLTLLKECKRNPDGLRLTTIDCSKAFLGQYIQTEIVFASDYEACTKTQRKMFRLRRGN